ncbi:MAG: DUF4214 domain-containing protein [Saccharofermentans sp.]|nr:DUF4214 domain-containing protein [Saccharofermentans sp.]
MKNTIRIIASILASSIIAVSLSNQALAAGADKTKTSGNTSLGVSAIQAPRLPESSIDWWSGNYVYFGTYDGNPIRFRVLTPNTTAYGGTTIFLDSDAVLFRYESADYSLNWQESEIRQFLNNDFFVNSFSTQEQNSIAVSQIDSHVADTDLYPDRAARDISEFTGLTGDRIFLLDAEECFNPDYGYAWGASSYSDDSDNQNWVCRQKFAYGTLPDNYLNLNAVDVEPHYGSFWALRTSETDSQYPGINIDYYGSVQPNNRLSSNISPAMNINLDSIIFATETARSGEYTLTVIDESIETNLGTASIDNTVVTIPFNVTGSYDRISLLITDGSWNQEGSSIINYSEFDGSFNLSSLGLSLDNWGTSYHVYLIAEDINEEYYTDYASTPVEVEAPSVQTNLSTAQAPSIPDSNEDQSADALQPTILPTSNSSTESQYSLPAHSPSTDEDNAGAFVERLYSVILNRASDIAGKEHWISEITDNGYSAGECVRGFLNSQEFLDKEYSDEEYLNILYSVFMDREADEDGFNYWMNMLSEGASRNEIIDGFIGSREWTEICKIYNFNA